MQSHSKLSLFLILSRLCGVKADIRLMRVIPSDSNNSRKLRHTIHYLKCVSSSLLHVAVSIESSYKCLQDFRGGKKSHLARAPALSGTCWQ